LFIDDSSPDGTGDLLETLKKEDKNLFVIHRKEKLGIGSAHKDGISWAYSNGYSILITMDSDFSHSPDEIEKFIKLSKESDLIVGTRFKKKGGMGELSFLRRFLSTFAHYMTYLLLRMPYDSTNAFRLYRLDRIHQKIFSQIESNSYSFFFESLYLIHSNKIKITETPITLGSRPSGDSKMSIRDAITSVRVLSNITYKRYFKSQ
jgi:dolichol-phosphate mannosyltransferase